MRMADVAKMFALGDTPPAGTPGGGGGGGGDTLPGDGLTSDEKQALADKRLTDEIKKVKDRFRPLETAMKEAGITAEELPGFFKKLKEQTTPPPPPPPPEIKDGDIPGSVKLKLDEMDRKMKEADERTKQADEKRVAAVRRSQMSQRDQLLTAAMEAAGVIDELRPTLLPALQAAARIEGDDETWKVYVKWKDSKGEEFDTPIDENPVGVVRALLPASAFKAKGAPGAGGKRPGEFDIPGGDVIVQGLGSQAAYERDRDKIMAAERRLRG